MGSVTTTDFSTPCSKNAQIDRIVFLAGWLLAALFWCIRPAWADTPEIEVSQMRLQVAPTPIANSGLGVSLGQSFEDLDEALGAIQRISRWRIADAAAIDNEARHSVDFRFRLDVSQLPRPFQLGVTGRTDWNLAASRNQRLQPEPAK